MTVRDRNQSVTPKTNMSPENSVWTTILSFWFLAPLCREHWSVSGANFLGKLQQLQLSVATWPKADWFHWNWPVSELGHWKSWKSSEPWVGSTLRSIELTYPTLNLPSYLYFPGGYYGKGYFKLSWFLNSFLLNKTCPQKHKPCRRSKETWLSQRRETPPWKLQAHHPSLKSIFLIPKIHGTSQITQSSWLISNFFETHLSEVFPPKKRPDYMPTLGKSEVQLVKSFHCFLVGPFCVNHHMCYQEGLNSHCFPMVQDGHQPCSRGLYAHYKDSLH